MIVLEKIIFSTKIKRQNTTDQQASTTNVLDHGDTVYYVIESNCNWLLRNLLTQHSFVCRTLKKMSSLHTFLKHPYTFLQMDKPVTGVCGVPRKLPWSLPLYDFHQLHWSDSGCTWLCQFANDSKVGTESKPNKRSAAQNVSPKFQFLYVSFNIVLGKK